jgi:SAM-dependent methyltransferase
MSDIAYDKWQANLPSEIEYWQQIIRGTFPNPEWVAGFRKRLAGEHEFPRHLRPYLNARSARILDVGSGPATTLGPIEAPCPVEIVPIDPLAETYGKLLRDAGLRCWNPTRPSEGERLSELGLGTFDLVHSRNALDHAYDPLRVIKQMMAVCRPGGTVYFEGSVNESVKQNAHGLHQWNFMPLDTGDLVVWRPDNNAMSLRAALGHEVTVKAAGSNWYQVEVRQRVG